MITFFYFAVIEQIYITHFGTVSLIFRLLLKQHINPVLGLHRAQHKPLSIAHLPGAGKTWDGADESCGPSAQMDFAKHYSNIYFLSNSAKLHIWSS